MIRSLFVLITVFLPWAVLFRYPLFESENYNVALDFTLVLILLLLAILRLARVGFSNEQLKREFLIMLLANSGLLILGMAARFTYEGINSSDVFRIRFLRGWLPYSMVTFLLPLYVKKPHTVLIRLSILLAALTLAVDLLFESIGVNIGIEMERGIGMLGNSNVTATFLLVALGSVVAEIVNLKGMLRIVLYSTAAFILLAGLSTTGSRGAGIFGTIGITLVAITISLKGKRIRQILITFGLLLGFIFFIASSDYSRLIMERLSIGLQRPTLDDNVYGRIEIQKTALNYIFTNISGIGFDRIERMPGWPYLYLKTTDNQWLDLLAEVGFLGIPFIMLLFVQLYRIARYYSIRTQFIVIPFCIASFAYSVFYFSQTSTIFWLLLGTYLSEEAALTDPVRKRVRHQTRQYPWLTTVRLPAATLPFSSRPKVP
jgi:hypothetical protein